MAKDKEDPKIDPKAAPKDDPAARDEGLKVSLRHTTPYPRYYRAGLALTNRFQDFTVSKGQLAILEKDSFVEVKKP